MTRHLRTQARRLREALAARDHAVSHSEALELLARTLGRRDWNTLAAEHGQAPASLLPVPDPWRVVRSPGREGYEMGADPKAEGVLVIRARPDAALPEEAFGSLMVAEDMPAGASRLILRAELATHDAQAATIWLRFDAADGRRLAFENLMRAEAPFGGVSGTAGWTVREISLDVPPRAARVCYGVLLKGPGEMRAREVILKNG